MKGYPRVFHTSVWVLAIVAGGLVCSLAGTMLFVGDPGRRPETIGFALLSLMFAAGLLEGLVSRVVLGEEHLEIVSNFRRTRVRRAEVRRVVGEKGVPVEVQLESGAWLRLPSLGGGPHPNTVRAWLLRPGPEADATSGSGELDP